MSILQSIHIAPYARQMLKTGSNWAAYTPTITANTGTFTTVAATGRWAQINKIVFVDITITITTNGTAAGSVKATLPVVPSVTAIFAGRENALTGSMVQAVVNASPFPIFDYKNSYPGGDGAVIIIGGFYEIA